MIFELLENYADGAVSREFWLADSDVYGTQRFYGVIDEGEPLVNAISYEQYYTISYIYDALGRYFLIRFAWPRFARGIFIGRVLLFMVEDTFVANVWKNIFEKQLRAMY